MNHDVLDLGKRMLDIIMDAFGDGVGVRQLHRAVDCDFHVDVDLVPEHARAQHVDAFDLVFGIDELADLAFELLPQEVSSIFFRAS